MHGVRRHSNPVPRIDDRQLHECVRDRLLVEELLKLLVSFFRQTLPGNESNLFGHGQQRTLFVREQR